jgi:hypothetical protein
MILEMGKYGNHNYHFERRIDTDEDVVRFLNEQGINFEGLVESCRQKNATVPRLENRITPQFIGGSPPGGYMAVKNARGETLASLEDGESGPMTMSTYWSRFERAVDAYDRCLSRTSYEDLLSAISSGTSSLEAYIHNRAEDYNRQNSSDLLEDSKDNKVTFDDKVKYWVPKISGKNFDKGSNRNWSEFKELRRVRDQEDQHPGTSAYAHSFKSMEKLLNLFRGGVAGLLLDLCIHFGEKQVPTVIIRRAHMPKVRLVANDAAE